MTGTIGAMGGLAVTAMAGALPVEATVDSHAYLNDENGSTVLSGESVHHSGVAASGTGIGVAGSSDTGIGVEGSSSTSYGVWGASGTGTGVYAQSVGSYGVDATGTIGVNSFGGTGGVHGSTASGYGVRGDSTGGAGCVGSSYSGDGVQGYARVPNVSGVYGTVSDAGGYGVFGRNTSSAGSTGYFAHARIGAAGQSDTGTGVVGYTGATAPTAPGHTGVYGVATEAGGRGGMFKGRAAQLRLVPSTAASHPASGDKGDFFVDASGSLWFCQGSTNWKKLA